MIKIGFNDPFIISVFIDNADVPRVSDNLKKHTVTHSINPGTPSGKTSEFEIAATLGTAEEIRKIILL